MLRKRIKKRKPLITNANTKSKLHSNSKSTYFYSNNGELSDSKSSCDNSTTDFRWASSHCEQYIGDVRMLDFANRTQPSREKKSYSRIARGRTSYILPSVCALALLLVLGVMINPFAQGGDGEKAYAAINEDLGDGASIALSISNGGTEVADDGAVSTQVKPGEVAYISNDITINTTKIKRYYVGVQSAGADSSLTGESSQAKIAGVGENVYPVNFGDNTWGYALVGDTTSSETTLQYNTLPAYNDNAPVQYQSKDNPTNGTYKMRLIFAANIRADKPADHYKNTALVSVAAEARDMLWADYGLTTMQGMTSDICKNAEVGTTGQLKDTRDQKLYWATKLADGNCWMTQNLDLDIPAEGLKAADTDIAADWNSSSAVPPVATTTSLTDLSYDERRVTSYDPGSIYCNNNKCDLTESLNEGHDNAGNYYNWAAATSGGLISTEPEDVDIYVDRSICPKAWMLPYTGETFGNLSKSFTYLIEEKLGLSTGLVVPDSVMTLRERPYYFTHGNYYSNYKGNYRGVVASKWWSSVAYTTQKSYSLFIGYVNGSLFPASHDPIGELVYVRCVAR